MKPTLCTIIILLSGCQSAGHGTPSEAAGPPPQVVKSLNQPNAAADGTVLNSLPVITTAEQNQYGSVVARGVNGAAVCAAKAGAPRSCADLSRCTPLVGGTATLDYLEAQLQTIFVCDPDGKIAGTASVVVKGGGIVEAEGL